MFTLPRRKFRSEQTSKKPQRPAGTSAAREAAGGQGEALVEEQVVVAIQ